MIVWMQTHSAALIIALGACLLLTWMAMGALLLRCRRLARRMDRFASAVPHMDLEDLLARMRADIADLEKNNILREDKTARLERELSFAIQKIGFVRYDAFADTVSARSGKLSFSIAFLDGYNNGFLLSSIYGSSSSVSYAKPVRNAASSIPLSDEEKMAIENALHGGFSPD